MRSELPPPDSGAPRVGQTLARLSYTLTQGRPWGPGHHGESAHRAAPSGDCPQAPLPAARRTQRVPQPPPPLRALGRPCPLHPCRALCALEPQGPEGA